MKTKREMRFIKTAVLCGVAALMTPLAMSAAVKSDFNGDGWGDLAVGSLDEDVNGQNSAGGINIIYGSSSGLSKNSRANAFFTQDSPGCPETPEAGDQFGFALATGDFNKDGYSDLAVGAPREGLGGLHEAGIVQIFYGTSGGLRCSASSTRLKGGGGPDSGDFFGWALAAGDFDQDGDADLAIGSPSISGFGMVTVLNGSSFGLQQASAQLLFLSDAEPGDFFGGSLAAGNFGKARTPILPSAFVTGLRDSSTQRARLP